MYSQKAWIFQGNQKKWDLNSYLQNKFDEDKTAYFTVGKQEAQIEEGNIAYIWRAGVDAGIVALGRVVLRPTPQKEILDLAESIDKPDPYNEDGNTLKAGIKLSTIHIHGSDNYFPRKEFERHPILGEHHIVTLNRGTVFSLNEDEVDVLRVKLKKRWEVKSVNNSSNEEKELDYAEEIGEKATHLEGAKKRVTINAYERNSKARKICLKEFGYKCSVCDFDFEKTYGSLGKGYIHVHHIIDISSLGEEYIIDPINDLRPVCPNCHSMLHRNTKLSRSVEDLKELINKS